MQTRVLTGTGLEVSRVCLGTMTFGGQTDRAEAAQVLHTAFEGGVNFLDTANVYSGGESERILGELLGARRQSLVLASKVFGKVEGEQPGLSRAAILASIENSLRRLRTDYLDIYYMHAPDYAVPVEESLEAMNLLVRTGKVRYAASSNYASWQVARMLQVASARGFAEPRVSQPMYNLLARRIEDEFLPMCEALGVDTVVYNPLAGGLLTGKHDFEKPLAGTRFDGNRLYLDRYWNEAAFAAVQRLEDIARGCRRSMVSFALNWLLHHTPAGCIILGASRAEQLRSNLAACAEGQLPGEAVLACDEVWASLRGAAPKYNR